MTLLEATLPTPIGELRIHAATTNGAPAIVAVHLPGETTHGAATSARGDVIRPAPDDPLLRRACSQLTDYFEGRLTTFDLLLHAPGTPWQLQVWAALGGIPYGATRPYLDIARDVGKPGGSRAVGQANGANRIPIIVPCHRVIASGGKLGGYSGGLQAKQWLLEHERQVRAAGNAPATSAATPARAARAPRPA